MSNLPIDVLVNKEFGINFKYEPNDLVEIDDNVDNFHNYIDPTLKPRISYQIYFPYRKLEKASIIDGHHIVVDSGYRSSQYQEQLYEFVFEQCYEEFKKMYPGVGVSKLYRMAFERTNKIVSQPGHSEHQTGYAFDAGFYKNGVFSDEFIGSEESEWMDKNAYKYGFILRYPEGKEEITGYDYEPWHYRYVGEDMAEKIYNNGNWLTLEEYTRGLRCK